MAEAASNDTGGAGAGGSTGDVAASGATSMLVTAASGGVVSLGGASVRIPAGALAANTMLTLAVSSQTADQTARGDISGSIYDFGPSGTTFKAPVDVELPLAAAPPADKEAVVAWLDAATGQWVSTPSTVTAGKITGQVTHLTSFAVLLSARGASARPLRPAAAASQPELGRSPRPA